MKNARLALAAMFVVLGAACSDDLGDGGDAGGAFDVGVSTGTMPNYSWGAGPALGIRVSRASATTIPVWQVADPVNRSITSPVRHGQVPGGATELVDDERTLTPGVRYRVEITLADNSMAFREFTP
jgi:hypothetical protein